jgi:hypothetical protein
MKHGFLSEYFAGVAGKRLSAVESDALRSHQHEFNGDKSLRQILGEPDGKVTYPARALYMSDELDEPVSSDTELTWYDARQKARLERNVQRWEYRLYFKDSAVSELAREGDLLLIGKLSSGALLLVVARGGSSIMRQLEWLFGFADLASPGFVVKAEMHEERDRIALASRFVLREIGVEVEETDETFLDEMLQKFGSVFPSTREFSAYARSTVRDADPRGAPDHALVAWMEQEETLFRTLERHLIADRLQAGFVSENNPGIYVDGFIEFSLSVQNRRKSRVGLALEHHLETILQVAGIRYSRAAVTEHKARPDFLFPGIAEYRDTKFAPSLLTMLGVKSTCKDRWRQVLSEAARIANKHLLTLEPAISTAQTDEMWANGLQLVVPEALHPTYTCAQRKWLVNVGQFLELVRDRQMC